MVAYLVQRLSSALVTLFIISIVCFVIINLPAGDVMDDYEWHLRSMGVDAETARETADGMRQLYGLNRPLPVQYGIWLSRFVQGDFGFSLITFQPVSELIWTRLARTVLLSLLSMTVAWSVGISLGIYSATHQYSLGDYVATMLGFLGLSIPGFLLALVLLVFTLYVLRAGVPTGLWSQKYANEPWTWAKIKDLLAHLWIPVLVAGVPGMAGLLRIMRGNLLDILGEQYVEMARAKGLRESTVILKHAVRVAINPLVSMLGMQFPSIISASVVVSIVLGIPTVGPMLFDALKSQDIYVSGTILMFLGILLVIGNFVADLLLAWVDPRIRISE
jgi:peptide/nickel transport system permease protein